MFCTQGISKIKFENLGNYYFLKDYISVLCILWSRFDLFTLFTVALSCMPNLQTLNPKRNAALLIKEKGIRSMESQMLRISHVKPSFN